MEVLFLDYFSSGVSLDKLQTEIGYPLEIYNDKIKIIAGELESTEQTTIINKMHDHVADESPYCYHTNVTGTLANMFSVLPNVISGNDFENYGKYIFFSTPVDLVTLLSNYVEPEPIEIVEVQKKNTVLFTSDRQVIRSVQTNEIILSKTEGQYNSLKSAIDYVNTLVNKAVIIKIYPGVYVENTDIYIPNEVCIIGQGNAGNTTISGTIYTGDFNLITNINITRIIHNGSLVSYTLIKDCLVGRITSNTTSTLLLNNISVYGAGISSAAGNIIMNNVVIESTANCGIKLSSGAVLTSNICTISGCTTAIDISGGSTIKGVLITMTNCTTGIHIKPTGKSNIIITYAYINSTTNDIIADSEAAVEIYSGHINVDKIIQNTPIDMCGIFCDVAGKLIHIGENIIEGSFKSKNAEKCSVYDIYLSSNDIIYYFETADNINSIQYFNGSSWVNLEYYKLTNRYWLNLNYTPTKTVINGIEAYWLKTDVSNASFKVRNCIEISDKQYYLGNKRKKSIIYINGRSFITPDGVDTSTPYEINIQANPGIILNGQLYGTSIISVPVNWTNDLIQSFTLVATNITMIAIKYYTIF